MFYFLSELLSPYYYYALIIVSAYFFLLSLANHYEMWLHSYGPEILDGPMVSVLIPMRNEEKNARRCIEGLQNQLYKNYEILVINDNSTDNTGQILEELAAKDDRIKVFNGEQLPSDWYGKPYALEQLSRHAKGEILILTDADTIHKPASISWGVTHIMRLNADMVSGYVGQIFGSFAEKVTIPIMFFLTGFVIPLSLNRYSKSSLFSAACGQYIAIKTEVFKVIGGCEAFKKKTSEDIYMSRYVKKNGYSTRFLNITEHVQCRMYNSHHDAVEGIGKNIFDFFGKRTLNLFLIAVVILAFMFMPFILLIGCIITLSPWTLAILAVNVLYSLTWIFMFLNLRISWWYGFLWPLFFLNLLYLGYWSWFRTVSGKGFNWKDRMVS